MSQSSVPTSYTPPDCCICIEALTTNLTVLTCGHVFHASCVTTWMNNHSTCPFCKAKQNGKGFGVFYSLVGKVDDNDDVEDEEDDDSEDDQVGYEEEEESDDALDFNSSSSSSSTKKKRKQTTTCPCAYGCICDDDTPSTSSNDLDNSNSDDEVDVNGGEKSDDDDAVDDDDDGDVIQMPPPVRPKPLIVDIDDDDENDGDGEGSREIGDEDENDDGVFDYDQEMGQEDIEGDDQQGEEKNVPEVHIASAPNESITRKVKVEGTEPNNPPPLPIPPPPIQLPNRTKISKEKLLKSQTKQIKKFKAAHLILLSKYAACKPKGTYASDMEKSRRSLIHAQLQLCTAETNMNDAVFRMREYERKAVSARNETETLRRLKSDEAKKAEEELKNLTAQVNSKSKKTKNDTQEIQNLREACNKSESKLERFKAEAMSEISKRAKMISDNEVNFKRKMEDKDVQIRTLERLINGKSKRRDSDYDERGDKTSESEAEKRRHKTFSSSSSSSRKGVYESSADKALKQAGKDRDYDIRHGKAKPQSKYQPVSSSSSSSNGGKENQRLNKNSSGSTILIGNTSSVINKPHGSNKTKTVEVRQKAPPVAKVKTLFDDGEEDERGRSKRFRQNVNFDDDDDDDDSDEELVIIPTRAQYTSSSSSNNDSESPLALQSSGRFRPTKKPVFGGSYRPTQAETNRENNLNERGSGSKQQQPQQQQAQKPTTTKLFGAGRLDNFFPKSNN